MFDPCVARLAAEIHARLKIKTATSTPRRRHALSAAHYLLSMDMNIRFLDPRVAESHYAPLLRAGARLCAASDAPRRRAHYEGEQDLACLAAALLWAVTRAHALVDGNKRASVVLADEFLALNGHHLAGAADTLYQLIYTAAAGRSNEAELAAGLRTCLAAGVPERPFAARYPDVIERLAH